VIIVFLALGSLIFYSGDDERQSTSKQSQKPSTEEAALTLTDADRDTYVNTIQTMSARNKELQERLERLERREHEQKIEKAQKERELQSLVNTRVEERARSLTETFSQKYDKLRAEFSEMTKMPGKQDSQSGMPKGLGLDDFKNYSPPGSRQGRAYTVQSSNNAVTIIH
jgi:DNA anti-recombination protein RmuC